MPHPWRAPALTTAVCQQRRSAFFYGARAHRPVSLSGRNFYRGDLPPSRPGPTLHHRADLALAGISTSPGEYRPRRDHARNAAAHRTRYTARNTTMMATSPTEDTRRTFIREAGSANVAPHVKHRPVFRLSPGPTSKTVPHRLHLIRLMTALHAVPSPNCNHTTPALPPPGIPLPESPCYHAPPQGGMQEEIWGREHQVQG